MSDAIQAVPLLEGRREWAVFFAVILLAFGIHLAWLYYQYRTLISKPFYYTWATVLQERSSFLQNSSSKLLKLRSVEGLRFFTRISKKETLLGKQLRLQLFPSKKISFFAYLKGAFIASRIVQVRLKNGGFKNFLASWINRQHNQRLMADFYRAIFLADYLPTSLRRDISALGVSHLVALSGFHLGILWGVIFFILKAPYSWLQKRFFPWRFILIDLGTLSLFILGAYLYLTDTPPSLLRSFVMLFFGWGALLLGIELLSFHFLLVTGATLLVFKPALLLSMSFWLSMTGVFFIFLLLRYFSRAPKWIVGGIILPLGVFLLMFPVGHTLFEELSPWQFLSPLLSLLFIPFYPIAILLHLLGVGGVLDQALEWLFALPQDSEVYYKTLPSWTLWVYIATALLATRKSWAIFVLFLEAIAAIAWLYLS